VISLVRRLLGRADGLQRRVKPLGVGFAVVKKFGDDDANVLAVALAWYGFTAIYPLLLIVVTVLGYIGVSSLGDTVVRTLHQFPVIGTDFNPTSGSSNLHGSPWAAVVGIVGLLYGAQGVTQTAEHAMARAWNVPRTDLPGFFARLVRSLGGLGVISLAFLVNAMIGGFTTAQSNPLLRAVLILLLGLLNIALFFAGFWALTPRVERRRQLLPGAVLAGIGFTLLTSIGTGLVEHQLRNSSNTYGAFASIIGVVTYLLLLATLTLYAAELNPVLARRLWPRGLAEPPTPADDAVLRGRAGEERRRTDEEIDVRFDRDRGEKNAVAPS
jgi:YihY family inner membrane protein